MLGDSGKITLPFRPASSFAVVVDLEALTHNYQYICSKLPNITQCAGMVKADAYGCGMGLVAEALEDAGCKHFFVANIAEGMDLRRIVDEDSTIYVLSGLIDGEQESYLEHDLIPVLNSLYQVISWNDFAKTKRDFLPAILHIDTGITRTGINSSELDRISLTHVSNTEIRYVMSHLACAYDPGHTMNDKQLQKFDKWRRRFHIAPASLANSGGVFLGSAYHMDMVRPGIAIYGSLPGFPQEAKNLKAVVKAYAQVLQVQEVPQGTTVGYDATFVTSRASRIATLGVGYADGYHRILSNRGQVYVGGRFVPVVGRISMDLMTIDVTDLPGGFVAAGDWVELMGEHITVDMLANLAGTASWELLTGFNTTRAHRYYTSYGQTTEEKVAS